MKRAYQLAVNQPIGNLKQCIETLASLSNLAVYTTDGTHFYSYFNTLLDAQEAEKTCRMYLRYCNTFITYGTFNVSDLIISS